MKNQHAIALGSIVTPAKQRAAREVGRLYGGRPSKLAVLIRDAARITVGGETYSGRRTIEALRLRLSFEPAGTQVLADAEDITGRINP